MQQDKRMLRSAGELAERLDDPDWIAVDCRFDLGDPQAGRRGYETGHIPGAVFLDLDRDLAGPVTEQSGRHPLPDADALSSRLGNLGIGPAKQVVVYDAGPGAVAARAWWTLRWLGLEAVYLLDGGLGHWQTLGLPVTTARSSRTAETFEPQTREERVLGTDELAANVDSIARFKLLDARDRARFRGESEPIDPVAGHIPGAINLPFSECVRADGTWLPLSERAALVEAAIGPERDVEWSVMCGSGVTACHLAISGIEAGFREPRLYVGSWSEWIRNPRLPIGVKNS